MRARVAIAVVMSIAMMGCAQDSEPEAEPDTQRDVIKIAIEGPMSGDQKSNGIDMRDGIRLAIDEANEEGVLGRELQLVEADDAADPEKGKEVAREMIEEDVFAVIGPYNSSVGVESCISTPVSSRST